MFGWAGLWKIGVWVRWTLDRWCLGVLGFSALVFGCAGLWFLGVWVCRALVSWFLGVRGFGSLVFGCVGLLFLCYSVCSALVSILYTSPSPRDIHTARIPSSSFNKE